MLASELRHKATVNWERIRKQREAKGYDFLLKQIDELAENGCFSHTFCGDIETCTFYMHNLKSLGFRVDMEECGEPVYSLYIDWN